jgi:hypothetical protein
MNTIWYIQSLKYPRSNRGLSTCRSRINQPDAIPNPEQYDSSMDAIYITAECIFQLQHTVIAAAKKDSFVILHYMSTGIEICRDLTLEVRSET